MKNSLKGKFTMRIIVDSNARVKGKMTNRTVVNRQECFQDNEEWKKEN